MNQGISDERIKTMYNGINVKEIRKVKELKNGYDACFLAWFAPHKGLFDIVKIWKKVCENLPDAQIAIIGTGLEKIVTKLRRVIKEANLERNVSMLGPLSESKKYAVLKSSKIFFYPSYSESWGIVVCEAMACGLPIVAYDLPAYEVYGDDVILKVPVGDTRAFSKATLELLMNEGLRRKMSKKARTIARRLDWDEVMERELNALFRSANGK